MQHGWELATPPFTVILFWSCVSLASVAVIAVFYCTCIAYRRVRSTPFFEHFLIDHRVVCILCIISRGWRSHDRGAGISLIRLCSLLLCRRQRITLDFGQSNL